MATIDRPSRPGHSLHASSEQSERAVQIPETSTKIYPPLADWANQASPKATPDMKTFLGLTLNFSALVDGPLDGEPTMFGDSHGKIDFSIREITNLFGQQA